MRVVVDTNVIVSGFIKPYSSSGEIVRMIVGENLQICFDARIISEYKQVLLRPKFSFDTVNVEEFVYHLEACGITVAALPLIERLPDINDEPFLEVSIAGNAKYLITGNLKHYPSDRRHGTIVVSPSNFIKLEFKR